MSHQDYKDAQEAFIKKYDLKKGDKVVVENPEVTRSNGWNNSWTVSMTKMIGSTFEIYALNRGNARGIRLEGTGCSFPYTSLKPVKLPVGMEIYEIY